jgi:protein O-mannosyl-transferase
MNNKQIIKYSYLFWATLLLAGIVFFFAVKSLFFFDEDIFVAEGASDFFKNIWQRSAICKFTYLLDNYFYGNNPSGYHITNIILHLANAALATTILRELLKIVTNSVDEFQSNFTALLFLVFFLITPVHAEPLCYILGRAGLLVTFFCLLSILFFLKAEFKNKYFLFFSLLSFLLALFTYELSWTLPFIILSMSLLMGKSKRVSFKKCFFVSVPFFLLFAIWFAVKVAVIDKFIVTDYKDSNILSVSLSVLIKNAVVLFFRNIVPPFKNWALFLCLCLPVLLLLAFYFIKLFKTNRPIFFLSLCLLCSVLLGFATVIPLGIDSHDSESERYIYLSSCFAIMLLSLAVTNLIKNKRLVMFCCVAIVTCYGCYLAKTMFYYKQGGDFSKKYLAAVNTAGTAASTVFLLNLPVQYRGALLFRSKSRMNDNAANSINTINEFMHYLYIGNNTKYVTLSAMELKVSPPNLLVYHKPIDSLNYYFTKQSINLTDTAIQTQQKEVFTFAKPGRTVIAFKDSCVFIFK